MCCSSIQNTFAWLGFLLVSAGFISLTAYGAVKFWPLGFGVCGLYTALLFWLANRAAAVGGGGGDSNVVVRDGGHSNTSEKYNIVLGSDDNAVPIAEQQQESPVYNYPIYANLLYALGVVGLAVTGLFLPFNLLPCSHRSDSSVASGSHNQNCSQEKTNREWGLGILMASGLPMLAVSIVLWRKKHVPSMGLTSYLAASLCYSAILAFARPNVDQWDHLWPYWLAIAGFLVMAVLAYSLLLIPEVGSVLAWGLNTGGLSFFLGMSWLLLEEDLFWRWFLLNLLCFFPLVFLGAVTRSVFLMFLGAYGFLNDAERFAKFLADHIRADERLLVVFFVLSCSGCAIACAGLLLSRHQEYLRAETIACLQSFQSWIRRHGVSNTEIDESLFLVDDELAVSSPPSEDDGRNFE